MVVKFRKKYANNSKRHHKGGCLRDFSVKFDRQIPRFRQIHRKLPCSGSTFGTTNEMDKTNPRCLRKKRKRKVEIGHLRQRRSKSHHGQTKHNVQIRPKDQNGETENRDFSDHYGLLVGCHSFLEVPRSDWLWVAEVYSVLLELEPKLSGNPNHWLECHVLQRVLGC